MGKRVGPLIKEARTNAGLTQEQLARKAKGGLTASDISQAERALKELTNDQLKLIAKVTGVTQKSLLDAAKLDAGKRPGSSGGTSSSSAVKSSMQVTATERRLVELYRAANTKTRKSAMDVLRGNTTTANDLLGNLLAGAFGSGTREMPEGEEEESGEGTISLE